MFRRYYVVRFSGGYRKDRRLQGAWRQAAMFKALAVKIARHGRKIFKGILNKGGEGGIRPNPRNNDAVARFGHEVNYVYMYLYGFLLPIVNFLQYRGFCFSKISNNVRPRVSDRCKKNAAGKIRSEVGYLIIF